nr:ExeM/NucH family extracellular endonuclease [Acidobacteriota bacterium]
MRPPTGRRLSTPVRRQLLGLLLVFSLTLLALPQFAAFIPTASAAPSPNIVISQVYGGGGNTGAPFTHDFVELFNRGTAPFTMTGWSIQYASATGTGNFGISTQITELPTVTLAPGQYLVVQEAGGANGAPLPSPGFVDPTPIAMAAGAGKVALVNTTTSLGCNGSTGSPCSAAALATIVDLVGYGSANFFEGSGAAPTLTNSTAALRAGGGTIDTDNNAADFAAGAPAPHGTDSAPAVASTSPAGGASGVGVNSNINVTFSEPVTASGNWFTISCTVSGSHTAAASGGPTTFTLNPNSDFANGETCTVTVVAAQVADQDVTDPPDNMAANHVFSFTTAAADPCASAFTPIFQIQGSGPVNTANNTVVTTKGVVTGDFQGAAGLNGFFIQDAAGDGDAATSDGIFVFVPAANPFFGVDVAVGDVVTLKGRVIEFNTLTEIDNVTALSKCGTAAVPATTVVDLPETVNGELERYEGMLVTIPETLTVAQNFFQGRFGQVTLASDGRLFNPTNSHLPNSAAAIAQADENARRLLVLDDGFGGQNPAPIPYIGADNTLRAGDTVAGLTGVIDFGSISSTTSIRDYRLHPTVAPSFSRDNPRTAAPDAVGGNVKVSSFNVLNYFTSLDLPGTNPLDGRGANTALELQRQRDKIVSALKAIDADVFGLIEIENVGFNPGNSPEAIDDLVAALNLAYGAATYQAIVGPSPGTDAIMTAFLYKPARVTPVGAAVNYPDTPFPNNTFERAPLAQTFDYNANGERFTVVVNHLKSKSSCPAGGPDADQGDGQGCWNARRVIQAQALLGFISGLQSSSGDTDVLVMGDLNAYGKEDPITTLVNGGLVDTIAGHIANPYSFVFDGLAGYLDHALATPSLATQVAGVTEWHINTDEPSVIDYNTEFKPQDLYAATPYRSADHDPVVVGLNLNAPPAASAGGPYSANEGGAVAVAATGTDPDNDALTFDWDLDDDGNFETPGQSATFSAAGLDGPDSRTIKVRVTDAAGNFTVAAASVSVANAAPAVGAISATPAAVVIGGT